MYPLCKCDTTYVSEVHMWYILYHYACTVCTLYLSVQVRHMCDTSGGQFICTNDVPVWIQIHTPLLKVYTFPSIQLMYTSDTHGTNVLAVMYKKVIV